MSTRAMVQDIEWLTYGHVGISSKVIWCVMNDLRPESDPFGGYPHDPDDFSRCYLLLQRNPLWRLQIHKLAPLRREWAALVEHWDELEQMFLACFGGEFTAQDYRGTKPYNKAAGLAMYERMKEIETASRKRVASQSDDRRESDRHPPRPL